MNKNALPKKWLLLVSNCCQKLAVPYNLWKNTRLQLFPEINHSTWKNGWLKLILQKNPVHLKEWITGYKCSLQRKWRNTLKNGQLQSAFWKKTLQLCFCSMFKTTWRKSSNPVLLSRPVEKISMVDWLLRFYSKFVSKKKFLQNLYSRLKF